METWGRGGRDTRWAAMLVVAVSAGVKLNSREGRRYYTIMNGCFSLPLSESSSTNQSRLVGKERLTRAYWWLRPRGWTETRLWRQGTDAEIKGKVSKTKKTPTYKNASYPVIMQDGQLAGELQSMCYHPSIQQNTPSATLGCSQFVGVLAN